MTNIFLIVSNAVTNSCHLYPLDSIPIRVEAGVIESVRNWIIAMGGILVVIVALLSEWIKSLFKAKIEINVSNKAPHFMCERADNCGSINNEIEGQLWLEVRNTSSCRDSKVTKVAVESIYVRESADEEHAFSKLHEMQPRYLEWSGLVSPKNIWLQISPNTSEYAHVVTIKAVKFPVANHNLMEENSEDPNESVKMPILIVKSARQEYIIDGDFQDIIIKLRITGNTISTITTHLAVNWLGKNDKHIKENQNKFLKCEIITDQKKLKKLIKEGC